MNIHGTNLVNKFKRIFTIFGTHYPNDMFY